MSTITFFSRRLSAPSVLLAALCAAVALTPSKAPARDGTTNVLDASGRGRHTQAQVPPSEKPSARPVEITLQGTIVPNAKIEVRAGTSGTVEKVGFEEGDFVRKGQLLVQLASPGLSAEVAVAEAQLKRAELDYRPLSEVPERHRPQGSLEQAQAAVEVSRANLQVKQARLAATKIEAPWDGVMGASEIHRGEVVAPNTPLGALYDLSSFKVQFGVPGDYVLKLQKGQKVQVRLEPGSARMIPGEICFLAPAIDETTRTLMVKAKLAKTDQALRSGMYASVILILPSGEGHSRAETPSKSSPAAASAPAPSEPSNKIRDLQEQRLATLRSLVKTTRDHFKNGQVSSDELWSAINARDEAELDLCNSNEERINILGKAVMRAKALEEQDAKLAANKLLPETSLLKATADRLQEEILLEQARAK